MKNHFLYLGALQLFFRSLASDVRTFVESFSIVPHRTKAKERQLESTFRTFVQMSRTTSPFFHFLYNKKEKKQDNVCNNDAGSCRNGMQVRKNKSRQETEDRKKRGQNYRCFKFPGDTHRCKGREYNQT